MFGGALNQFNQSVTEACVANNYGIVDIDSKRDDVSLAGVVGVGGDGALYEISLSTLRDLDRIQQEARIRSRGRLAILHNSQLHEILTNVK